MKQQSKKYNGLQWAMLFLVGLSMTFSTLHSHHRIDWDHTHSQKHTDTGNTITVNTNLCPVCGYMFGANAVSHQPQPTIQSVEAKVVIASTSQCLDSYSASRTGRSPPSVI